MATYNETVAEDIENSETLLTTFPITLTNTAALSGVVQVTFPVTILNSMTADDTQVADQITFVLEHINLLDALTSKGTFNVTANDIVTIAEIAAVIFSHSLLEDITVDDTPVEIVKKLQIIVDQLQMDDSGVSQGILTTALAVAMTISDIARQIDIIAEDVTAADTILDTVLMALAILENVETTHLTAEYVAFSILVDDDVTGSDSTSNTASLHDLITDGWTVSTKFQLGDLTYTGWVMNPETYAVSTYSNFSFNSITAFMNDYLLASSTGLYSMGGDLDEAAYITSRMKTASMAFETSNRKQVPEVLLGVNNSGKVILTVSVDGQHTAYYELKPSTQYLDTQQIKVGKGLHGRYWQFELVTKQNSTFDLDTFEFLPVVFGRKLR